MKDRLETLLGKLDKTELEEREEERLLREYAKEHHITYSTEYSYQ